jgi:hypothetical protein
MALTRPASTHRMRTKIYIKELESEVLRLRKSEGAAVARAEMLDQKCQQLLGVLHHHGIHPPPEPSGSPWAGAVYAPHTNQETTLPMHPRNHSINSGRSTSRDAETLAHSYQSHDHSLQLLPDNGDLSVVPSLFVPPDRIPGQQVGHSIEPGTPFRFDDSQAELDFILTYGNQPGLLVY